MGIAIVMNFRKVIAAHILSNRLHKVSRVSDRFPADNRIYNVSVCL